MIALKLGNFMEMDRYGVVDWKFLTTNSLKDLDPILDGYSQE